jgi:chromosome segregation ATPase
MQGKRMADLAELERRVSRLEAAQNDNTGTLKWIAEQVGRSAGTIAVLQEDMTTLKEDMTTLKEDMTTLKEDMTTLKGDVRTLKEDRKALDGKVEKLATDLSSFRREFGDFQNGQARMIADVMREVLKQP